MKVATPARMPTPLHKLLNVLLAMDGAVECATELRTEDINVWDGARVHTVTGTALPWQRPPAR